jgi:Ni/Fe-hydrogenase subunit HybB-like protein
MADMLSYPVFWVVAVLSIGIPVVFITGVRLVASRAAGRPQAIPTTASEAFHIAIPRVVSPWKSLRNLAVIGVLATGTAIILVRFVFGLGAVTNLSDQFALGFWIGFDVMTGVALAAGGFTMAAIAHVFNIKRFEPLVRPAILTALLGYILVIVALLVDLGRPYNVWRPLVHWQYHSVLWEVGVCVATYTMVLFAEFLPVILERVNKIEAVTKRLPTIRFYGWLKKVSIVFIILGIVLSTLHQSSLGSLWVLMPTKVHPLWYSVYLPVFFWLSAVAIGLCMTIVESNLSSRAFKRGLEKNLLEELGKGAAIVLAVYGAARAADLTARGAWPTAFEPTLQAASFWVEILAGIIAPMILFAVPALRRNPKVLLAGAAMVVVFGAALNRLNVSWIGLLSYTGNIYAPSWMEIVVTITILGFGVLAFYMIAKYLSVFPEEGEHLSR